jgi:hypothetical protein
MTLRALHRLSERVETNRLGCYPTTYSPEVQEQQQGDGGFRPMRMRINHPSCQCTLFARSEPREEAPKPLRGQEVWDETLLSWPNSIRRCRRRRYRRGHGIVCLAFLRRRRWVLLCRLGLIAALLV